MNIETIYNLDVKMYALKLIKAQMKKDDVTSTIWKNTKAIDLDPDSIYSKIASTSYFDLVAGNGTESTVKKILEHFKVQFGIYCVKNKEN